MDPKTEVMQYADDGVTMRAADVPQTLASSDIVSGNRYNSRPGSFTLTPDPDGPWLALVTHRGENAPPRPATLPVGTRVRRGPDWCWEDQDGTPGNVGTVDGADGADGWVSVDWGGGSEWLYRWGGGAKGNFYDLEVVSLPEAPAEKPTIREAFAMLRAEKEGPGPKTWPFDPTKVPQGAVLIDHDTQAPIYNEEWWDHDGFIHRPNGAIGARNNFANKRFIAGRRYDTFNGEEYERGWLCVRDFTGKDWRPSGAADKTPGLVTPAEYAAETPAFKVGDRVRLRDDVTPAMLAKNNIEGDKAPRPGEVGCILPERYTWERSRAGRTGARVKFARAEWWVPVAMCDGVTPSDTITAGTLAPGDTVNISTDEGVTVEHALTTLPRHHRVMLDRLRAAGWVVVESNNDIEEAGMATRGDTRILITPDAIRVVPKKPACTGTVGVSLDYASEQAAAVIEAADIIHAVWAEWDRASEQGFVPPATPESARRIIPVEGFHDMEHLLEDAEPAGIVPRPSR